MQSTQEIWKSISGFEGLYEISSLGRIRGIDRKVKNNSTFVQGKILKPRFDKDKYLGTTLSKDGIFYNVRLHILVAKAFIPNPFNKPLVGHIDNIPWNNFVFNLEWCTYQENHDHMIRCGNGVAKKSREIDQYDMQGNFIKRWRCIERIIESGIARKPAEVAQGKRGSSGGFKWKYAQEFWTPKHDTNEN